MVLGVLALPASARAQQPFFDVRDHVKPATPNASARALKRSLGRQAVLDVDPVTRTPRVLARLDGALTAPKSGTPRAVALAYVRANLAALGLKNLDTLRNPTVTTAGTITEVRWRQGVGNVTAADSELRVNVAKDGRVISVLGAPASDLPADTTPQVSAQQAVKSATDATKPQLTFYAQRLAWRFTDTASDDAVYDTTVDAETGKLLRRANLVKFDSADVWDNYPRASYGGDRHTVSLTPWLTNGSSKLDGANVHAFADLNDDDVAQSSEEVAPGQWSFTTYAGVGCDDLTSPCSWNGSGSSWPTNVNQNAVQAFYLANVFHDHLKAAPISFTDRPFEGADKLELNTDDGANQLSSHQNNANMLTWADGRSPLMQMYLWGGTHRAMNGGDDASILFHEYTHGLTNRLVVDADGAGALNSAQAGAMGEGWSDWYAKDFLVKEFPLSDTATSGDVSMGDYTDLPAARYPATIRTQGLDCPVGVVATRCPGAGTAGSGGYTYADLGKIDGAPEVHADGEIWAETLWDLRTAIGSDIAERLVTDALRLSPPEPTFLDERNAILQADHVDGTGKRDAIWSVFAKRGMGFYATSEDGADTSPTEDFNVPPTDHTQDKTLSGTVTDATLHRPIAGATVSIGGLDAGPDQLTATTDSTGHYALSAPAYNYANVVISDTGYDRTLLAANLSAGDATLDATLRRDWAARDGGATASTGASANAYAGLGCGANAVIDQRQTSTWSVALADKAPVTLQLPVPVDVSEIDLDPGAGCGDDDSASTRAYKVETSATSATAGFGTWAQGNFSAVDNHRMNPLSGLAIAVRWIKLTPMTSQGGSFIDFSEIAVYGRAHLDPPDTTITSGPQGIDSDPTPTFTFVSDQSNAIFECRLDADAFAACASPYTVPTALTGQHSFDVRAVNLNGEPDASPAHRGFSIDTSLPHIDSGPSGVTNSAGATFTFSNGTNALCRLDTEAFAACTSPVARTGLADGQHTFAVTTAGYTNDPTSERTWTIDTHAPVVSVNGSVSVDAATFTFSATDLTTVTFKCSLDGATPTACTSPAKYTGLSAGSHTLTVIGTDEAGNPGTGSASVQAVPYTTHIDAAPNALVNDGDVRFEFSSSPAGAGFQCSLDGATFTTCTSPRTYHGLADGAHTFDVRAVGPGSSVGHAAFTVDTTPPDVIFTFAPLAVLTGRDFDLGFTANEPATFTCQFDGGDSVPCASPLALRGLADGQHHVLVTATDLAGNIGSPSGALFTVAVPLPAPTITPTPTPTATPAKPDALTSARVPKTASLKALRKHRRFKLTVRAPRGAKVAVATSLGKLTKTSQGKTLTLSLTLDRKKLKAAKAGTTLKIVITAQGTGLRSVTRTFKVKLKA